MRLIPVFFTATALLASLASGIPQQSPDKRNHGQPLRSVLPLLVETSAVISPAMH